MTDFEYSESSFTFVFITYNLPYYDMQSDEKLILSLIKDDLINSKLVNALGYMGLDADDYLLHLKETVLDLMGFTPEQRTDKLYEEYVDRTETMHFINLHSQRHWVDLLAADIYKWLLKEARGGG